MTTRNIFMLSAVLTMLLALAWLIVPAAVLAWWGAESSPTAIFLARRHAVLYLGFGILLWDARGAPPSPARRAIATAGLTTTALMAFSSMNGVLAGTLNANGWISFTIEGLLAACFAYLLFQGKD